VAIVGRLAGGVLGHWGTGQHEWSSQNQGVGGFLGTSGGGVCARVWCLGRPGWLAVQGFGGGASEVALRVPPVAPASQSAHRAVKVTGGAPRVSRREAKLSGLRRRLAPRALAAWAQPAYQWCAGGQLAGARRALLPFLLSTAAGSVSCSESLYSCKTHDGHSGWTPLDASIRPRKCPSFQPFSAEGPTAATLRAATRAVFSL
jgi:hypothetical protein